VAQCDAPFDRVRKLVKCAELRNIFFMLAPPFPLPPMNALAAFDAAARHLSFTHAGEELNISREAVSRHIRNLEGHLGVKLFRRVHRAVELTEAGRAYQVAVRDCLRGLATAAEGLRRSGGPARVTVTATIAIASFWLTPRLPRFRTRYPDVELRVAASDAPVETAMAGVDLGLRYGSGAWLGLTATHLFDVESFPVCAPDYLQDAPPLKVPADLTDHTLLNLEGAAHAAEDWTWWLARAGVPTPSAAQRLGFDSYANVIDAAVQGQGVALGFGRIVGSLLRQKKLVRPISAVHSRGREVYLVVPRGAALSANAKKFFDWIRAEAASEAG